MTIDRKATLCLIGLGFGAILIGRLTWDVHWGSLFAHSMPGFIRPNPAIPAVSTPPARTPSEQALIDSQTAVALATAPFNSVPPLMAAPEPPLGKNLGELIKPPPGGRQDTPPLDPRKLRALMDRGVVTYAGSSSDKDRQKGAELIQTAALLGFTPARSLVARNFPQSEPVRRAVPARDAISYALDFFTGSEIDSENAKAIFMALAEHFARQGQIEFFTAQFLEGLRGDNRPQLSHRIDTLLELFTRVRGACLAVARIVSQMPEPIGDGCSVSLAEDLRRYIEIGRPVERDAELRRRGLIMLDQVR